MTSKDNFVQDLQNTPPMPVPGEERVCANCQLLHSPETVLPAHCQGALLPMLLAALWDADKNLVDCIEKENLDSRRLIAIGAGIEATGQLLAVLEAENALV